MDFTDLSNLSAPVLLVAFLNALGFVISKSPVDNKYIPLMLPVVGACVYPFLGDFDEKLRFWYMHAIVHGLIIGAGAVGTHQALRQLTTDKTNDTSPK